MDDLARGPFPTGDGWGWVYRGVERLEPDGALRTALCAYFRPTRLERWRNGLFLRALGVGLFGRIVPTGGITVRRLTGARMAPYTLAGTSVRAARAFYYRACVFEALHLPFCLAMVGLMVARAMEGRWDLVTELFVLNAAVNLYPMLHHRRTRARIIRILQRRSGT